MKHRSFIVFSLVTLVLVGARIQAAFNIPFVIQEAIYPGVTGVTRTSNPVSAGIPLPDDPATGVSDVSQLTLTGATIGQFRVLGRWPSGRIKWVLVDTLATVSAGGRNTSVALASGGSGNFGGSSLATDNGSTISVATGTATFTVRKANFNGFHQVVVGGATVVAAGASAGLVITGPAPGNTTCGICTTVYSSANDASSTAVIEENGPVRAVIKATGAYKDSTGSVYMRFTVRMHFYKGLSRVKAVTTLRNADNGTSNSLATAYKGLAANEWRLAANIGGTRTYSIAKDAGTVETGTLSSTEDVYLYSAQSDFMKHDHWGCCGAVSYTDDTGWVLRKNGSTLDTGTSAANEAIGGWADIRDGSGAGVSIGVYQMAAYWPKSLEFKSGGSDVRIGIWPSYNSRAFHQAWPQWSTHDLYFNFHDAALASPANEFLQFQHPLLARAALTHYNTTKVFPYPIVDPTVEDAFFASTNSTAVPTNTNPFIAPKDAFPGGIQIVGDHLTVYRVKYWQQGGESNQQEFRWSWLFNFIQRGFTGRYVNAMHFYRFLTDDGAPHSDGFNWRDQSNIDGFGRPAVTSANSTQAFTSWYDQEHYHWYGMPDFYFMSGDELVKEAILDGYADWHLSTGVYQSGVSSGVEDGLFDTRADAVTLLSAARMAVFLNAIGNTADATTVLNNAERLYDTDVKSVLCTNAEAASQGCTPGPVTGYGAPWPNEGISRTRGTIWSGGGTDHWCGVSASPNGWRFYSTWSGGSFTALGLWEFANAKGSGWSGYWDAKDLVYGIAQGAQDEFWYQQGNGRWDQDGWRLGAAFDRGGNCDAPPPTEDQEYFRPQPILSHWMIHYMRYLVDGSTDWAGKVRIAMLKAVNYTGANTADFNGYQLGAVIAAQNSPSSPTLQNLTITSFINNGGGTYTVGWTVPNGASSYRIKWGPKRIVDWIGFDARTNTFVGNPATTMNWFAATNVATLPTPAAVGSTQTTTINTGTSGLTAANFSVKAYVGGVSSTTPPSSTPSLVMVSGNNQSGAVGTRLSTPFTVKVIDGSGNPMNGVNVSFAVTGGGGSLTASVVATDSSGLASSFLTLGSVPGANLVSASSGAVSSGPVTFTAQGMSTSGDQSIALTPNQWLNVTPAYQGQTNGGQLTPFTYNNMGVYDPQSKRTISFERWYDPIRKMSIYANALVAYEPASNVATVLKVNNWAMPDTATVPLPENATDPTPIDRHPLGGVALDPAGNAVYLVNGANQTGHLYYPDHPNDTWKFSLSSGSWTKVSDAATAVHPPTDASAYAGMVYDPPTGKLAYFVVTPTNGTRTWLLDTRTNQWSLADQDPSATNVYISIAGIAYDTHRNLVLAFGGGSNSVSGPSTKLWAYSVLQNKWTALPDAPIGGEAAEFAYDSTHDVFLALAGRTTMIYNPRTRVWSRLAATIDRGTNLNRQNVTYNPAQDVFVFEGGSWDKPVWSLFRYSDPGSPALTLPTPPTNVRIIRQ